MRLDYFYNRLAEKLYYGIEVLHVDIKRYQLRSQAELRMVVADSHVVEFYAVFQAPVYIVAKGCKIKMVSLGYAGIETNEFIN